VRRAEVEVSERQKLSDEAIEAFLGGHPGWERGDGCVARTYVFDDYAAGIAFVVRVGFAAEARDHHPDIHVGWRRVRVIWSTHDARGVTTLDTEMAERTDALAR
jgi:4a-hydroxytetrahydrobiopterin dehydratase